MIIKCDAEYIKAYLDGIQTEMDDFVEKRTAFEQSLNSICENYWTGTASENFKNIMQYYLRDMDNTISCLKDYSLFLKNYVSQGQEIEKKYDVEISIE